jgi:hypothetical protein
MTLCSDQTGATAALAGVNRATHPFGPYLQSVPNNPFVTGSPISGTELVATHWVYNAATGSISAPAPYDNL